MTFYLVFLDLGGGAPVTVPDFPAYDPPEGAEEEWEEEGEILWIL